MNRSPERFLYKDHLLLDARTSLQALVARDGSYRLSLQRGGATLVEYWNDGSVHRRRVHERTLAYEFRSVEKLRYDFESDLEDAVHRN